LFFRRSPTDFSVSPVGKPGTTTLIMMQKLAAVGPEIRGRKVAISLSPSWFFTPHGGAKTYEGNFSPLLASEMAFATELSWELRRQAARRMLESPRSLKDHALLHFALQCLATDQPRERFLYRLVLPIGWLQNAVGRLQDHIETGFYIRENLHSLRVPSRREMEF